VAVPEWPRPREWPGFLSLRSRYWRQTLASYRPTRPDDAGLRERLKALAQERRRFGYRRLHVLLRPEGRVVNHKRLFRLYREERLMVRRRGGRKRAIGTRSPMLLPDGPNVRWSLDFVHDQLGVGRRFRILSIVDDCTRESLALVADTSISGVRVARELGQLVAGRGKPRAIVSDNGTELTSNAILRWADDGRVAWHYIAPGKPTQNAFIELQWTSARRAPEGNPVPFAAARPRRPRGLAQRLQPQSTPLAARLARARRLRRHTRSATGFGAAQPGQLRAAARCCRHTSRPDQPPDSTHRWIKVGGNVTACRVRPRVIQFTLRPERRPPEPIVTWVIAGD
jgi:putative transposase